MTKAKTVGAVHAMSFTKLADSLKRELYSRKKKNSFVCRLSICKITNNYIYSKQGRNTFISGIKNADYNYGFNQENRFNPKVVCFLCQKGVIDTG